MALTAQTVKHNNTKRVDDDDDDVASGDSQAIRLIVDRSWSSYRGVRCRVVNG